MNKFFITGLPRSRTAWLASFFTGNNSFCYHEMLRISSGFEDGIKKMLNRKEMYVGNSDSSLPIWMDKIDHILRDSPIVIIERDVNEISDSLTNLFGQDFERALDKTLEGIEIIKNKYNYISIDYNELNNQSCLETLCNFCTPKLNFDKDKFETLKTINISLNKNLKDLYTKSVRKNNKEYVNYMSYKIYS
jgi:hypothetical protein